MIYLIGYSINPETEILLTGCNKKAYYEENDVTIYYFEDYDVIIDINWDYKWISDRYEENSYAVEEFKTLQEAERELIMRLFI